MGNLFICLDHDVFGLDRPKNINVIDSNKVERDAGGKPHPLFLIPLQRAAPVFND
ncbi:hypothetical protein GOC91_00945 [Sinorhizobium medicae]|uniref:Uncharacterized protein n=1 Tax=Sinorhizobium medicae TaxID=110321 RepID=A0A6G1WW45_9HYPH|nr:hypothetical protein [Sinorhizobium medicae]MDX0409326.1 hypothetical protein [Sinorhizobium medicae]MDX0415439.1 hypothetical protein [Sinorhizobium medicae]MDX0421422.1 hypothetical protein [Sinorhizobium medicae]MDX0427464.1 hypothetical protein [Sinorhizobium medicae]